MHKYLIFDLDGTLAKIGKGILTSDIKKLHKIEKSGYTVAICSGKPTYYLCGFFRQAELQAPIFIGENGAVIQFGVDLPPKKFFKHPISQQAKEQLANIKTIIENNINDIWFQPNEVAVTPFPKRAQDFKVIHDLLDEHKNELDELFIYPQCDCFDITPKNISKSSGLQLFAENMRASNRDFVAIGDGINDIPMFEFADVSISVGNNLEFKTDYSFDNISDVLDFILEKKL